MNDPGIKMRLIELIRASEDETLLKAIHELLVSRGDEEISGFDSDGKLLSRSGLIRAVDEAAGRVRESGGVDNEALKRRFIDD